MGRVKNAIMEAIEKSQTIGEACDLLDAWGMHGFEPDDEMMVEMWKCMKDEECRYCGGNCPNEPDDSENLCDGYAGDIDGLYKEEDDEKASL